MVDGPHRTPEQVGADLRSMVSGLVLATVMTHHANHGESRGVRAIDRLHELAVPVLVLVGALDFADLRRVADRIAGEAPQARKVVLDGVGHLVQNEAPERFLAAVRAFLAAVPSPG